MSESRQALEGHPSGDDPGAAREVAREAVKLDTFGGAVHVEWDPDAAATPLGHLAVFAEYLKVSGRFDALVAGCPLYYTSLNAPSKRNILGTLMLSILAGAVAQRAHHRAARRRGQSVAVGHEQGGERGFRPARSGAGRGGGWCILASRPSRRHGATLAERAVGSGLRHHDQAALRPSGRGGGDRQGPDPQRREQGSRASLLASAAGTHPVPLHPCAARDPIPLTEKRNAPNGICAASGIDHD